MATRIRPTLSELLEMDNAMAAAWLAALPPLDDGSAQAFLAGFAKSVTR